MRVERSFYIRVVQVYEGEPPADWDMDELPFQPPHIYCLNGDQDQYVCDNWELISDETDLCDNDELETLVL